MTRRTTRSGSGPGRRNARVRVRTARQRTPSSQRWLERQLNDPYVAAAKREGYRSRAAYKLIEIDDRYRLLRRGQRLVDLGSAPGGWSQVAAARVGAIHGEGQVIALDMCEMEALPGVEFIRLDFLDRAAPGLIKERLRGGGADVVLSDMAAPTTGHSGTDHLRIMALAEAALELARDILSPGGTFVTKVFQGGAQRDLLDALRRDFSSVRHVKPPASRSDSAELYLVATGFRGKRAD